MNVTKQALIKLISEKTGASIRETGEMLDALEGTLSEQLASGNKVRLGGVGSFSPYTRSARVIKSPMSDSPIEVPERTSVKYKPGKALRTRLAEA